MMMRVCFFFTVERSVLGRSVCKRSVFGTFGLRTRTLRPRDGSWAV